MAIMAEHTLSSVARRRIFLDRPSAPENASKAHASGYIEGPRADNESLRRARRIYFRRFGANGWPAGTLRRFCADSRPRGVPD